MLGNLSLNSSLRRFLQCRWRKTASVWEMFSTLHSLNACILCLAHIPNNSFHVNTTISQRWRFINHFLKRNMYLHMYLLLFMKQPASTCTSEGYCFCSEELHLGVIP